MIILWGLLLLFSSCTKSLVESPAGGLYLQAKVAGAADTKAVGDPVAGEAGLNENKLTHLDVFIGKDGDFSLFHKRFSSSLTTTDGRILIAGQNWDDIFTDGGYDIYIIANAAESSLSSLTSKASLLSKYQTNSDIHVAAEGAGSSKTFLMDGMLSDWTPSGNSDNIITVELHRAASKITLSLSLSSEMTSKYSIGTPQWKLRGIESSVSLLSEAESLSAGDNDSGDSPLAATGELSVTTYSYPCSWEETEDAPYFLVNIPLTPKDGGEVKSQNWYRIPVCSAETKKLERNHLYSVSTTISSEGSTTELSKNQDLALGYSVADWITKTITIDAVKTNHLLVSPASASMRNVSTDSSIEFYASGDIEIVNKEVYYYDKYGAKQSYSDASSVGITPSEGLSGHITISSPIPDGSSTLTEGKYTVRFIKFRVRLTDDTDICQDVLVKQYPLEFIQNIEGWYSTRSTDGWIDWQADRTQAARSRRKVAAGYEKISGSSWSWQYGNGATRSTYDTSYEGVYVVYRSDYISRSVYTHFSAKVFYNSEFYLYTDVLKKSSYGTSYYTNGYSDYYWYSNNYYDSSTYGDSNYFDWSDDSSAEFQAVPFKNSSIESLDNNHMYVIQITSTGDTYTISHPVLDSNGQSSDDVVSPAFMLASQLGATTPFTYQSSDSNNAKEAARHCTTYREVGMDGTVYDGWRLPTKAEIGVMMYYQPQSDGTTSGAPIDAVLKGASYWAANGEKISTGYSSSGSGYVRCVRDLSPEELKKLEQSKQ